MSNTNYQPHIDGLRALAILSVLFYHAKMGCPGGYVGVDVFFVISGYLITSLILKDLHANQFSLVAFWERRVRRIFPALAATVLVTLIASCFLLLPEHLEKLGRSTVAQVLLAANFYFWRTTNYFGGPNDEKPLLHTWSLAVEEQFYLFFPLILIWLFRRTAFRQPRVVVAILLAWFATSLGIATLGVKYEPYATFFLLPTRAWELLCGAIVAVLPKEALPISRTTREIVSWLGLVGILLPVCVYSDTTSFPGIAALPPCLGTASVIWANTPANRADGIPLKRTLPAVLLSLRWVTFIGLISYSLYLWHWPIFAFANYWKTTSFSQLTIWSLIGVSFVLAILSWNYIETPFRKRTFCKTRTGIFSFAAVAISVMFLLGTGVVFNHGLPGRIPLKAREILAAVQSDNKARLHFNKWDKNLSGPEQIKEDELPRFGIKDPKVPVTVLLWGDSHAGRAIPVFDLLCKQDRMAGCAIVTYSTPPLLNTDYHLKLGARDPITISAEAVKYVKDHRIPNTFLLAYWSSYERIGGRGKLEMSLKTTIHELQATGTKVWVILDWPDYDNDVTKTLVRKIIYPQFSWPVALRTEIEHRRRNRALYDLSAGDSDAVFLDPAPFLFNSTNGTYKITDSGFPLYSDNNHLSLQGAKIALLPLLRSVFEEEIVPQHLSRSVEKHLSGL
jgi:peptidoglycan/LPS O-acetylase OafA/YrhL